MAELRRIHEPKMHPEYARRLFAWLESKQGFLGIGGGWRLTQPLKDGVAPEGKSFHQSQTFASGFIGYCAVDLVVPNAGQVHRAPTWKEVPQQGSAEALRRGVHCNVGSPLQVGSEPWHMQPVEIDGYDSWVLAGRLDPVANYPLPGDPPPPEEPVSVTYFKVPSANPLSVFGTSDGFNATRIEEFTAKARGIDVFAVPTISQAEADKYVYQVGFTSQSVK